MITLAIPKGRVQDEAIALFARAGVDLAPIQDGSRRLVFELPAAELRVLVVRDADVPTYVEQGAADIGISGRDVLEERGSDLYEPLDLGIGKCRMIVAERKDARTDDTQIHLRIATKYPRLTTAYLQRRGIHAEVIELSGSIELGPLTGLCHRIVDITQTGETLKQNGLVEIETVCEVSTRLVVNPASLKLRGPLIAALIDRLETAIS